MSSPVSLTRRSTRQKTKPTPIVTAPTRSETYREDVLTLVNNYFCKINSETVNDKFDPATSEIDEGKPNKKWNICHETESELNNNISKL